MNKISQSNLLTSIDII